MVEKIFPNTKSAVFSSALKIFSRVSSRIRIKNLAFFLLSRWRVKRLRSAKKLTPRSFAKDSLSYLLR